MFDRAWNIAKCTHHIRNWITQNRKNIGQLAAVKPVFNDEFLEAQNHKYTLNSPLILAHYVSSSSRPWERRALVIVIDPLARRSERT